MKFTDTDNDNRSSKFVLEYQLQESPLDQSIATLYNKLLPHTDKLMMTTYRNRPPICISETGHINILDAYIKLRHVKMKFKFTDSVDNESRMDEIHIHW